MDKLMRKKILGLIPTRIGSVRLPAKALLHIGKYPLIIHVYKRVKLAKKLEAKAGKIHELGDLLVL